MKIRPLNDNVLIEFDSAPDKTPGGLYVPDTAQKDRPHLATVRQIHAPIFTLTPNDPGGSTGSIKSCPVQIGDKVLVGKYSGTDFSIEGKKFVFVKDDELLGVIED